MFVAWIIALVVPVAAVLGWPWFMARNTPTASGLLDDPMLLLVQFFLAAAPLVAMAIFSLTRRAARGAIMITALLAGLATALFWGWYHSGATGLSEANSGLALLASPVVIGVVAVFLYWLLARRRRT